jgi:hypothetical protein
MSVLMYKRNKRASVDVKVFYTNEGASGGGGAEMFSIVISMFPLETLMFSVCPLKMLWIRFSQ